MLREKGFRNNNYAMGLCIGAAKQRGGSVSQSGGAENGVRGAIGFIVASSGGLPVQVVPVFECAGADSQEGEDKEDGGEATQGEQEYAVSA